MAKPGAWRSLWLLWATVGLVLLIACVNVASLLAVRAESRRREECRCAPRWAPSDGHLLAQSITESTVLVLFGTALGVVLASIAIGLLRRYGGNVLPRMTEVRIDGAVLIVRTGLVAARRRVDLRRRAASTHRADGGSLTLGLGTRGGTSDAGGMHMRHALVVAQVAMAAMLLVVCGLMVRTARNLTRVDVGFRPDSVLTFRIALPEASYPTPRNVARFHDALLDRIRGVPGVVAAGATSDLPLIGTAAPGDPLRTDHEAGGANTLPPGAEECASRPRDTSTRSESR